MRILFLNIFLLQVNPDPYLRADPEIDIMKKEDEFPNGMAKFYDEEELGWCHDNTNMMCLHCVLLSAKMEERLRRKLAWRKHINMFTRRRLR